MKKYYKGTVELELKITQAIEKHTVIADMIIGWLRKIISEDVRTYYVFTEISVFTEEHIRLKPELRHLLVKSSKSRRLSTRNKEAKKLIDDWISYRDEHDIDGVIKSWNPFNDSETFIIREAFMVGEVVRKRCPKTKQVIFESDCEEPDLKLVTEITEKEYHELALSFLE